MSVYAVLNRETGWLIEPVIVSRFGDPRAGKYWRVKPGQHSVLGDYDASPWNDISDMNDGPMWQNNRCSHLFKGADGRAYDLDGRVFIDPDGMSFTGTGSRVFVTFPYTPTREYVKVDADGEPLEGPSRAELASQ